MSLSGNTVDFGEMSANSIYFLISRFFYLYFINCPVTGNGTIVHMKISGAESPDQKGTLAVSGVKGLVISFFVNGSSKLFVNGPSLDEWIIPESNKLNNIEVGTYLWKTGNITGGTFNSTAIIDVTYD
jgi:type 1 fimbria pilin